jgi:hypothetical protein
LGRLEPRDGFAERPVLGNQRIGLGERIQAVPRDGDCLTRFLFAVAIVRSDDRGELNPQPLDWATVVHAGHDPR